MEEDQGEATMHSTEHLNAQNNKLHEWIPAVSHERGARNSYIVHKINKTKFWQRNLPQTLFKKKVFISKAGIWIWEQHIPYIIINTSPLYDQCHPNKAALP